MDNKDFWNELCGTHAYRSLGLTEIEPKSIAVFDTWYMDFYKYLYKYLNLENLGASEVLEIGLGFGTVGELLFKNAKSYTGLDYSEGPVKMMNDRIEWNNCTNKAKAMQGDALDLPFSDNSFDFIVAIGCLHHTGDIAKSINEVFRVLRKGGKTLVMLYNKDSYRQKKYNKEVKKKNKSMKVLNKSYDSNSDGVIAPIIEFSSRNDILEYFKLFSQINIRVENFDAVRLFRNYYIPRNIVLKTIAPFWGLDYYITATK